MALATVSDVEGRLGRPLDTTEAARIDAVLSDATEAVKVAAGGDPFERATTTTRLRIRNGRVRLPLTPVNAVISVKWPDAGATDVGWWFWEGLDEITMWRTEYGLPSVSATPLFRAIYQIVDVNYDHGYTTVPAVVTGVVAQVAARALTCPPEQWLIESENLAGIYQYQGRGDALTGFDLTESELRALEPFTASNKIGSISISPAL